MNLKQNILSIFITFCCFNATAQVTFELTKFPKNNQLIPRNPATNFGTYTIVGTVVRAANITSLRVKISKDSILDKSITVPVPTTLDKFLFNIPIAIKAEHKKSCVKPACRRSWRQSAAARSLCCSSIEYGAWVIATAQIPAMPSQRLRVFLLRPPISGLRCCLRHNKRFAQLLACAATPLSPYRVRLRSSTRPRRARDEIFSSSQRATYDCPSGLAPLRPP